METKNLISVMEFQELFDSMYDNNRIVNEYMIMCAVQEKSLCSEDVEYVKATGGEILRKKITIKIYVEDL